MALRLLEKDRDHHRVLVDITNAVLSHLDLDDLIADVAREIHHFSVWLQSVWYWAIIERTRSSACGAAIFLPHIVRVCHAVCLAKVYC